MKDIIVTTVQSLIWCLTWRVSAYNTILSVHHFTVPFSPIQNVAIKFLRHIAEYYNVRGRIIYSPTPRFQINAKIMHARDRSGLAPGDVPGPGAGGYKSQDHASWDEYSCGLQLRLKAGHYSTEEPSCKQRRCGGVLRGFMLLR